MKKKSTTLEEILYRLRFEYECKEAEQQLNKGNEKWSVILAKKPFITPSQIIQETAIQDEVLSPRQGNLHTEVILNVNMRSLGSSWLRTTKTSPQPLPSSLLSHDAKHLIKQQFEMILSTTPEKITDRLCFERECEETEQQLSEEYEQMSAILVEQLRW